jgi:F420H(2)-dependent quinone reductase
VQTPPWFMRGFSAMHRGLLRLSHGRLGNEFRGAPVVLLTTTGRKTGKPRAWPLLAVRDGDKYVFAGSNSGHDRHPAWYLNLTADPAVTIEDRGRTLRGKARVVTGDEREGYYRRFVEVYPTYGQYAEATDREIPIVVVDPQPGSDA